MALTVKVTPSFGPDHPISIFLVVLVISTQFGRGVFMEEFSNVNPQDAVVPILPTVVGYTTQSTCDCHAPDIPLTRLGTRLEIVVCGSVNCRNNFPLVENKSHFGLDIPISMFF